MKKKLILLLAFIINLSYICFAQPDDRRMNKAEAVQIAYLTKELDLKPDEAQRFWPVFNNYKQELVNARRQGGRNQIETEERILNIRKKFQPEFRRVLGSDQRVNKLFQADRNFREMLRKELMERRNNNRGRGINRN